MIVLFTGARLNRSIVSEEISGEGEKLGRFVMFFVKWIAPVFMSMVLVLGVLQKFLPQLYSKISGGLSLITLMVIIYVLLSLFHKLNKT